VTRIILVMMLPLAALLGMLIDDLAAQKYQVVRNLLALALSAFLVAECSLINQYSSPVSDWRARLDALEASLPKQLPADAVLAIRTEPMKPVWPDWPWLLSQIDAEMAAVTLGISTLNGYSGNAPTDWKPMTTCQDIGDNLRSGRHFLAEHGLPAPDITPDRLVLVGFGRCASEDLSAHDPAIQLEHTYHFAQAAAGNQFVGAGFSNPESWGRWTDAKDAFLFFSLGTMPMIPLSIAIEASSLSTAVDRRQVVAVEANSHACGELSITASRSHSEVTCPAGALHAGGNMVHPRIADPTRPIDLGINTDRRNLGLGLQNLTLYPKE